MDVVTVLVALGVGLLLGAGACWLVLRPRLATGGPDGARLRDEVVGLRGELATAKAEVAAARAEAGEARLDAANARTDAANARGEAATTRAEAARAEGEIERARAEAALAREDRANALADVAGLEAEVRRAQSERDLAQARAAEVAADRESLVNQFKVLSAEALEHQGKAADQSADQRLKATELLMAPVRQSLERFEARLTEVEKERSAIAAELRQQVLGVQRTGDALRHETAALTTALRKPHVRGAWGELQLRRVVELAGMVDHCDFVEQATTATHERVVRPDLKVMLAAEKYVYVDSKVPLSAFLDAQDAPDDAARAKALDLFVKNVKTHVDDLSAKQYWKSADTGGSPEFVVMFLPSEALYAEALSRKPDLLEYAATRSIVLATPSTLIALLRTVAFSWTQASLAESAREVTDLGRQLYDRLGTLGGHVDKLGRALRTSVTAYNDAVASLESRVLVTARRFRDLKVTGDELDAPSQVDHTVRSLAAPELVDDAVQVTPMIGRTSKRALVLEAVHETARTTASLAAPPADDATAGDLPATDGGAQDGDSPGGSTTGGSTSGSRSTGGRSTSSDAADDEQRMLRRATPEVQELTLFDALRRAQGLGDSDTEAVGH